MQLRDKETAQQEQVAEPLPRAHHPSHTHHSTLPPQLEDQGHKGTTK